MLNAWQNFSIEVRLAIIAIMGVGLGQFANWAIYNFCFFPRPISPWGRSRWLDQRNSEGIRALTRPSMLIQKLPIIGWVFSISESELHGRFFWIRPFLIEILFPIFLCWLYLFEIRGGVLPPGAAVINGGFQEIHHVHFVAHAILCWLMLVATFIDFDERTIPDFVTVPGTLFALIGAATFRDWHLWEDSVDPITGTFPALMNSCSPWLWPWSWNGLNGLWLGLGSYGLWCFALADRRLILRRGWRKAVEYFFAGLVRNSSWKVLLGIFVVGTIAIFFAWQNLGVLSWRSLLSSLVGMASGGMLVWVVRIFARLALGVEAMGFGDVTLMAMVGAFLGWQAAWLGFFFAPFFALVFVLIAFIITGDNQAPFGPYLCAGSLFVLIFWNEVWNQWIAGLLLTMGPQIGLIMLAGLFLMFGMLWVWRLAKIALLSRTSEPIKGNEDRA